MNVYISGVFLYNSWLVLSQHDMTFDFTFKPPTELSSQPLVPRCGHQHTCVLIVTSRGQGMEKISCVVTCYIPSIQAPQCDHCHKMYGSRHIQGPRKEWQQFIISFIQNVLPCLIHLCQNLCKIFDSYFVKTFSLWHPSTPHNIAVPSFSWWGQGQRSGSS